MNKFTACLKNSVRAKRERESCVSVWAENGTKALSWMHRKEKIKLAKTQELAPCKLQGWGFEGAAHQWCAWEGIIPCFPGGLHGQEFISQTFFANFGTWIRVTPLFFPKHSVPGGDLLLVRSYLIRHRSAPVTSVSLEAQGWCVSTLLARRKHLAIRNSI